MIRSASDSSQFNVIRRRDPASGDLARPTEPESRPRDQELSEPQHGVITAWVMKLGPVMLWLLVLLVPLAFSLSARENFRLPKLWLSQTLGLASIVFLLARAKIVGRLDLKALVRQPVVLAVLPMLIVATLGLLTSPHDQAVRGALISLWIGLACLVVWSYALTTSELRDLLEGMIFPATQLALVAVLQYHHIVNPFQIVGEVERLRLTSLAGSAFDLAAYFVLPCLLVQGSLRQTSTSASWRWTQGLCAALSVYALALTQTLSAILALACGTLLFWFLVLSRRRFVGLAAGLILAALALGLAVEPLQQRVSNKLGSLRQGDVNELLSGRLDGWRAALWMAREEPWTGVGHGAYRFEFGRAREALKQQGVELFPSRYQGYFFNAHNDLLEAVAEWGIPGAVAVAWAIGVLLWTLRRSRAAGKRQETVVMWSGLAGLTVLALTNFPLRIALVAYPTLLFLSWIFATSRELDETSSQTRQNAAAG
ncbi:MAG: O-antigen ligase family protein [Acidobacteriota bacterium]